MLPQQHLLASAQQIQIQLKSQLQQMNKFQLQSEAQTQQKLILFPNQIDIQKMQPAHKPHPKAKFTDEEDLKLMELVNKFGSDDWHTIASEMEGRNVRQCRERWRNYLSPEIGNGPWTEKEDNLLDEKYSQFGPKWKYIATFFPKRTDINVKSRWLVHIRALKKKNKMMTGKRQYHHKKLSCINGETDNTINDHEKRPSNEPLPALFPQQFSFPNCVSNYTNSDEAFMNALETEAMSTAKKIGDEDDLFNDFIDFSFDEDIFTNF